MKRSYLQRGSKPIAALGKRGKRLKPGDTTFRKEVKAHAKGVCERCGRKGAHAHHVMKRKSQFLRHDRRNGAYLCEPCHDWAEHNIATAEVWFASVRPDDYLYASDNRFKSTKEVVCN